MAYPMLLPMNSANAANTGFSQLTASASAPSFFGQLTGTTTTNVSSSRHFNSNSVFPLIRDVPSTYASSAVADTAPSTTISLGGKRIHESATFTNERFVSTTSSISASSSVATAITRNIPVATEDSPYSEITPTSKRSRTATYNPPREVPNSILTAVGSLVGGTSSIPASDNSNNSIPTVTMRRNHSYNQIAPFVGNHDEMDTTDTSYNNINNNDSTRARSMSF